MTTDDELVLLGYSLPLTDLGVTSLISTQLPDGIPITPVNPSKEVLHNLRKLLPTRERDISTRYIRADPIPRWVHDELQ
jgi:hypothetical protein